MRTPSRGVIVASSSLFIQPSLSSHLPNYYYYPSPPSYRHRFHSTTTASSSTTTTTTQLVLAAARARAAAAVTRRMSTSIATLPPASSSSSSLRVRIVSYNLLSSKLASPDHFTHTHPDHLQVDYRLSLILSKLEKEMERGFGGHNNNTTNNNIIGTTAVDTSHNVSNHQDSDANTVDTTNESQTMASPPPPPTIFAFQEVCYPYASALHTFFASRGYHFVTGLYGRPFNGYMGVGIAYPLKDFETVKVDICRLSDTRPGGWPREAPAVEEEENEKESGNNNIISVPQEGRGTIGNVVQRIISTLVQSITNRVTIKRLGASSSSTTSVEEKKPIDPWEMSENRFNVLLTAVLRHRSVVGGGGVECSNNNEDGNSAFLISNYHMPCAYFAPAVMNIHSDMVAKRVQDLAVETWESLQKNTSANDEVFGQKVHVKQSIPYILAGDFNILPNSAQYDILTKGMLDSSDPTYPPPKHGMEWKVECSPMNSAYASYESEPEFTNYAHLKDDPDPFIGTLDYIFLSKTSSSSSGETNEVEGGLAAQGGHEWTVHGVKKLPSREDSGGPFPSEKEPSDHLLIAADLELVSM